MIQRNLFASALAYNHYTQKKLATEINMSESTMTRKLQNNSFTIDEADKIIDILHLENPGEIFFAKKGTC